VGWLVALPSIATAVLMIPWSVHSDRTGERLWHAILPALLAVAGLLLAAQASSPILVMVGFTLASIGVFSAIPPFWALPVSNLSGSAAAAASPSSARSAISADISAARPRNDQGRDRRLSIGLMLLAGSVALSCPLVWMMERAQARRAVLAQPGVGST